MYNSLQTWYLSGKYTDILQGHLNSPLQAFKTKHVKYSQSI